MNAKWFGIFALIAAGTFFLSLSSCGFNQHLVSINIPESGGTFGGVGPGIFFDFTATGTYIHPPATKDITDLVTWQSDNPQVVQVSNTGVVSPNVSCGLANISASFYDSPNQVVSNSVPITVDGPAADGCTPAGPQPILTVTVTGTTSGNVTSSPAGISCDTGSSCSSQFTTGQSVTLTATPASGFQRWQGCNATNGASCTVFLENSVTVTATFD
jgi:Divergent InlB B-repeat domain